MHSVQTHAFCLTNSADKLYPYYYPIFIYVDGKVHNLAVRDDMTETSILKKLKEYAGKEIGLSDWMEITQERINAFAECTEDRQWIHIDPEKAKHGPYGTTIAHGFLILSLIVHLASRIELFREGIKMVTNVGLDKVRFLTPVKSGTRIRNRIVLKETSDKGNGKILVTLENTIETEGERKPALVADVIALVHI
jgi:acyl dehydratase